VADLLDEFGARLKGEHDSSPDDQAKKQARKRR
jgi:hypothetical protein